MTNSVSCRRMLLRKGATYDKLPEVYLFYISEDDIWHRGQTVYEVQQVLNCGRRIIPYDNGLHTIYVNAEIDDGSNIAKLMQYLKTAKAGDTSQGGLSEYVNYIKSPEGGRQVMGEFERYFTEKGREQGMKQGMKQGRKEEKLENIKALMESLKVSAQEAMGLLKITPEEQQKLLPLL